VSTTPSSLSQFAAAIAQAEGYGVSGAIPTLANNPGDLAEGDIGYGTLGSAGITVFPSAQAGQSALLQQLTTIQNGTSSNYTTSESLSQMATTYAGPGGASNWLSNVASFLGISPTSTVGQVMNGSSTSSSSNTLSSGASALANAALTLGSSGLLSMGNGSSSNTTNSTSESVLSRGVFIALGLSCIIIALLSFDKSRQVIQTVGKTVTKSAEIASV
jgi:hypothetical protein